VTQVRILTAYELLKMPDIPKPNGPDINIGASLVALEWALAGIAGIILGLRLFTVAIVLRRVQLADYLILLAFVCSSFPFSYAGSLSFDII
jgi:hypothetical protein